MMMLVEREYENPNVGHPMPVFTNVITIGFHIGFS
jgi:hypothetical protein